MFNENTTMPLLTRRPRRLRSSPAIRGYCQETWLRAQDLVQPLFVIEGDQDPVPVEAMPGVERFSVNAHLLRECEVLLKLGISAIALFPKNNPDLKCPQGKEAINPNSLVLNAVRAVKSQFPELLVIADIALDPYTTHGHDGLLSSCGSNVDNDATLSVLNEMAVLHAEAGVDIVAPSDMMDGRVGTIRNALDEAGFTGTSILSYCAKYNSAFYGPFREAVGSAANASKGNLSKATYQMNPANRREALVEMSLDIEEGADILMIKPAGAYLDIIRDVRDACELPVAAYQVSGEYSQILAAAERGWLDLARAREESLLSIKRAGADIIFSYFAKEQAKVLKS